MESLFHDRQGQLLQGYGGDYNCYVILGNGQPWIWANWQEINKRLSPVITACRGNPWINVIEYLAQSKKPLKFGRLGWNEKSFEKWTTNSPLTKSEDRRFFIMESLTPSGEIAARENIFPDFFISLRNERHLFQDSSFDYVFYFALSTRLASEVGAALTQTVKQIAKTFNSHLCAQTQRAWAYKLGENGLMTNAIHHVPTIGLFKLGPYHKAKISRDILMGNWTDMC